MWRVIYSIEDLFIFDLSIPKLLLYVQSWKEDDHQTATFCANSYMFREFDTTFRSKISYKCIKILGRLTVSFHSRKTDEKYYIRNKQQDLFNNENIELFVKLDVSSSGTTAIRRQVRMNWYSGERSIS